MNASSTASGIAALACAPNFRDLGGLPAGDGMRVRSGRLFRSDLVFRPNETEAAALAASGIGLVIDLRSRSETETSPNQFWADRGVEIRAFDIGTDVRARGSFWDRLAEDASESAVAALMATIYRSIPNAVGPALASLFDSLAQGAPPALIHCAAGKDRTGVVVALLLHALGVPDAAIMVDYMETAARVTPRTRERARKTFTKIAGGVMDDASLEMLVSVRGDFLGHAYAYIDRKYGGIDAYLTAFAGLDADKRAAMRINLLERVEDPAHG
jgi:protein-tyrosine phosphatase